MARRSRTQPWFTLSVLAGNVIQLSGLLGGLGLVARAPRTRPPWGTGMLVGGWLATYFCNHAIGHWAVGRLVGIRFLGYGVHGTTAPGWYPPGMRWVFRRVPLFSARTDPASRRTAHPLARMAMYLGGPLFTGLTSLGIPLYGRASGVPRARGLLIGAGLFLVPGTVVEAIRPGGDLRRALRELRRITDHAERP
jgi:hypothetical protein